MEKCLGKSILCAGGAGYVGAQCSLLLADQGYDILIADNLNNSSQRYVDRIIQLSKGKIKFECIDLTDKEKVDQLFKAKHFDAVLHFAALKAVNESIEYPIKYYKNNLISSFNIIDAMQKENCKVMVFSSSATVYKPKETLITEEDELGPCNPYGQTKLMTEQFLKDVYVSDPQWKIALLRYFNPIGATSSGELGELPQNAKNICPIIQSILLTHQGELKVCGNDWDTRDGTGVRDYVHVQDIADGHIAALKYLFQSPQDKGVCEAFNLGTGKGISVLELIKAFEDVWTTKVPYSFCARRPGDNASVIADPSKAKAVLQWVAKRSMRDACSSALKWALEYYTAFSQST